LLDFGPVRFYLARHFGFCYGVENAIEIAYKTIEENPGKRFFLLSEMIHNPGVNHDLLSMGVRFIMDTSGNQLVAWEEIKSDDIVIIPAFGTTLEIEKKLNKMGSIHTATILPVLLLKKSGIVQQILASRDLRLLFMANIITRKPGQHFLIQYKTPLQLLSGI